MTKTAETQTDRAALAAEALTPCPRCSKAAIKAATGAQPGTIAMLCEDGHSWGMTAEEYTKALEAHLASQEQPSGKPGAGSPVGDAPEVDEKTAMIIIKMDRTTKLVSIQAKTDGPVESFGMLEFAKLLLTANQQNAKPKIALPPRLVAPSGRQLS